MRTSALTVAYGSAIDFSHPASAKYVHMQTKGFSFRFQQNGSVALRCHSAVLCSILLICTLCGVPLRAQKATTAPIGIAWQVKGLWQAEGRGTAVSSGDAIQPGSLLHPGEGSATHSILILLPDGQRILYECFLPEDCARNFRVPSLYRKPDLFAVDMLARIHAVLIRGNRDLGSHSHERFPPAPDEALVLLDPEKRVQVSGLVAALPDGSYTYDLRPLYRADPPQSHLKFEKSSSSISIPLPALGLYDVTIFDQLNTPRIDLFVAAVAPIQHATFAKLYGSAKVLMQDWNVNYQGWPIHDFQRAYLESLIMGIKPQTLGAPAIASDRAQGVDVTAEPAFSPRPGVFKGDTAVTLQCNTPGGIMHFTVDGSQPLNNSQVYGAPIMVKGTELTIKAFSSAPGKKDSAVVTGIFRIGD